jgi:hypothetical protein
VIIMAFLILSPLGLLFAYWLRVIFAGKRLGYTKIYISLAVNIFFMMTHMEIAQLDKYLYFGTHPVFGWIALAFFILHALALPVKRDLNWWWKR